MECKNSIILIWTLIPISRGCWWSWALSSRLPPDDIIQCLPKPADPLPRPPTPSCNLCLHFDMTHSDNRQGAGQLFLVLQVAPLVRSGSLGPTEHMHAWVPLTFSNDLRTDYENFFCLSIASCLSVALHFFWIISLFFWTLSFYAKGKPTWLNCWPW